MLIGIFTFILIPSAVFYGIESDWTYIDSIYYSFISLATIGFGDLTTTHDTKVKEKLGKWMWAYQAFTMMWLIFGLGFVSWINAIIAERIWKKSPRRNSTISIRRYSLTPTIMTKLPSISEDDRDKVAATTKTTTSDLQQDNPLRLTEAHEVADAVTQKTKSSLKRRRTDPCMFKLKP